MMLKESQWNEPLTIYIWTARTDKKYTELNAAALNVNIPCATSQKTAFRKYNKVENEHGDKITALLHFGELY